MLQYAGRAGGTTKALEACMSKLISPRYSEIPETPGADEKRPVTVVRRLLSPGTMGALCFYVLTLVLLVHYRGSLAELAGWGYPGVLLLGLVGGVGAAVGELTGYLLGTRSRGVVHKGRLFRRILHLVRPMNGAGIIALAILPFPFMGVGLWAGRVRYPLRHFLFFVTTGKVVKLTGLALGAYHSFPWLLQP